jgi:hypothetical protein
LQHLPFVDALRAAERLTGARPWLDEARCRELFRAGRVDASDLAAALQQLARLPQRRAPDPRRAAPDPSRRRAAGHPLRPADRHPACRLRWQLLDQAASERLQADLDPAVRKGLLAAAAAGVDERAAVAELWAAACELRGNRHRSGKRSSDESGRGARRSGKRGHRALAELVGRLGTQWTLGSLLAQLTGEDFRPALQATLIRHLAAHLDQGLAAWRNPLRAAGFYAAWRESAGRDWAWEVDEFAGVRHEIEQLPEDPLQAIIGELHRLGVNQARGDAYLQRLALELPGWAGMFAWRESHPQSGEPPVSLADFLAVRVVLERLYGDQLLRRIWGLPFGEFSEFGEHLVARPAELQLRHAFGSRTLPEEILDRLRPLLTSAGRRAAHLAGTGRRPRRVAERSDASTEEAIALAAWPLFVLAQRLGLGARELRAIGERRRRAARLCRFADPRHARRSLAARLRTPLPAADPGRARRQPRSHAARLAGQRRSAARLLHGRPRGRHPTPPRRSQSGATKPSARPVSSACRCSGRVSMTRRRARSARSSSARRTPCAKSSPPAAKPHSGHRRRRGARLNGTGNSAPGQPAGLAAGGAGDGRRGAGGTAALLARTLAPGRLGKLLGRCARGLRLARARRPATRRRGREARREASPEAPREGFSDDEQLLRVGGFLRSIGLTSTSRRWSRSSATAPTAATTRISRPTIAAPARVATAGRTRGFSRPSPTGRACAGNSRRRAS